MDTILTALAAEHLEFEEILLLMLASAQPPTHLKYPRLSIDALSDEECLKLFRFKKEDLPRLQRALGLAESYTGPVRLRWTGTEGLCILLRRLAYPNRLTDMVPIFGRSSTELGLIFNVVVEELYERQAWPSSFRLEF